MNTNNNKLIIQAPPPHQKGIATLTISVVVLLIVTLMVIFATKVGIFDLRMSANDYRHKEAFNVSDGGLEYAIQQFSEKLTNNDGNYIYDPDNNGIEDDIPDPFLSDKNLAGGTANASEVRFTASVEKVTAGGITAFNFTSNGESIDRTGKASVSEQVVFRHIVGGRSPDTPIIADGSMDVSGNMHVVPNPNASCPSGATGNGCAVSVWTHDSVDTSSSISTCQYQGFNTDSTGSPNQCPNPSQDPLHTQLTNGTYQGVDIIQNDAYTTDGGNFPADLFKYVFGVPYTDWQTIKSAAESLTPSQVFDSCSGLNSASKGITWITGGCQIGSGATIGSLANPIILVVQNHELNIGGNSTIFGIVYLFDETPADDTDDPDIDIGGGAVIRGALISGVDFDGGPGSGTFAVVWDPNVFTNIQNNSDESYRQVASIPGSWRDF